MANRTFQEKTLTIAKRKVEIFAGFLMSGTTPVLQKYNLLNLAKGTTPFYSPAPTTGVAYAVGNGEGVRSVTRLDTGKWRITMSDPYILLRGVSIDRYDTDAGTRTVATLGVVSLDTHERRNNGPGDGGYVVIQFQDYAGASADPGDGEWIGLTLEFTDASEP